MSEFPLLPRPVARVEAAASAALVLVAAIAICAMLIMINADVFGRLLLNSPLVGTIEVVTYYFMVAVIFLPMISVQRQRKQITVDLLVSMLPSRLQHALDALMLTATAAFFVLFAWRSGREAVRATHILETQSITFYELPVWPARWIIPVACVGILLPLVIQVVQNLILALSPRRR